MEFSERETRAHVPVRLSSGRLAVLITVFVLWHTAGCGKPAAKPTTPPEGSRSAVAAVDPHFEAQVQAFCGDCHVMPKAETFPRDAWRDEVKRGFDFYVQSRRTDLHPPVQSEVIRYFRDQAPESLIYVPPRLEEKPPRFSKRLRAKNSGSFTAAPRTSFVLQYSGSDKPAWFASDMENGSIALLNADNRTSWSTTTACINPAAVRVCDLDKDGKQALLCTDLGSFLPEDHDRGKLVLLRSFLSSSEEPIVLLKDVGRIADVQVGDIDADGDDDLVVAEFGWHETGGVHLLRNSGQSSDGQPVFEVQELDDRPGAIHVLITDVNDDQRQDVVALISQEHEQIVAYLNEGSTFAKQVLYLAPDPSWGSSGISLVDLDQDGDEDILYTNGDTFDSHIVKPYHGITWLEKRANLQFVPHRLADMPGVHRALAADLDQDGDLDIAAVALLPDHILKDIDAENFLSALWLEQTSAGKFTGHAIERGSPFHAAMTLSDVDQDGDIDIVAGNLVNDPEAAPLTFFMNAGN